MTAETALALPAVVLVLTAVLAVAAAGIAQMRAADAARAGARAAAIGESDSTIREIAAQIAGSGASVDVTRGEAWTEVEVSVPVIGPWLGALCATGQATARTEPSAPWPVEGGP